MADYSGKPKRGNYLELINELTFRSMPQDLEQLEPSILLGLDVLKQRAAVGLDRYTEPVHPRQIAENGIDFFQEALEEAADWYVYQCAAFQAWAVMRKQFRELTEAVLDGQAMLNGVLPNLDARDMHHNGPCPEYDKDGGDAEARRFMHVLTYHYLPAMNKRVDRREHELNRLAQSVPSRYWPEMATPGEEQVLDLVQKYIGALWQEIAWHRENSIAPAPYEVEKPPFLNTPADDS